MDDTPYDPIDKPRDMLVWLADRADSLGRIDLRADYLRCALLIAPEDDKSHYQYGVLCVKAGKPKEAIAHLHASLAATGPHSPTIGFLMQAYLHLGQPGKAVALAERHPQAMTHTKVEVCYAEALLLLGHRHKLVRLFKNRVPVHPGTQAFIDRARG